MMRGNWELSIGRLLVAALFGAGFVQKLLNPSAAQDLLGMYALPVWLVWPAALFNLGIAVLFVWGRHLRITALMAAAYCMLTSLFHLIPSDPWQMSIFVKNWVIAGGLLAMAHIGRSQNS